MKKILSIALAFALVLGLASSALAVSWAAPSVSSSASPFAVEVIKLAATTNVTGAKYYTVLSDAAAYDLSNIYFAIKLSVPSYANANSYYGNSGFMSGDSVKVNVNFTNVSGKSSETYYIKLTNEAQTLWYNGSGFDASWTASLSTNCGCGDKHILSAVAVGNSEITIKASVGASGALSDITIDGCYGVEKKTFYGVVPCVNCSATNLSGYFFSGSCSTYGVFFTTNSAGKVTAAYVADKYAAKTNYYGSVASFSTALYGWTPSGTYTDCYDGTCGHQAFALVELQKGDKINAVDADATWETWANDRNATDKTLDETKVLFSTWANASKTNMDSLKLKTGETSSDAYMFLYRYSDGEYKRATWDDIRPDNMKVITASDKMLTYSHSGSDTDALAHVKSATTGDVVIAADGTGYAGGAATNFFKADTSASGAVDLVYGIDNNSILKRTAVGVAYTGAQVEYGKINYIVKSSEDWRLYKQTSASTVNCDSNEASYLNALNHVYALLGFTYADWAAGNVYMTDDILLGNFGFSASVSDSKTWGAYTSTITVAPVTEIPATGSIAYTGVMLIVLAVAAAVLNKRIHA